MSWYSLVEDIYYSDEFPFPYDRFPMRKYPTGSNEMEPLKIHIKPEGKVDLLGSYQKLLFYYKDIATKPINDNEKNEKLMTFMSRHMSKGRKEELAAALEAINASGRPQKKNGNGGKSLSLAHDFRGARGSIYDTPRRFPLSKL